MSAHTPGPWSLDLEADGAFYVYVPPQFDMGTAATIARRGPWTHLAEESYANARLIAAAPDMLEALRHAVVLLAGACVHSPELEPHATYEAVSAAIAKATGSAL